MPNELATQTEPETGKLAVPLLERMDPAIGETTSVLGAIMTEFLRRTLRGGVLQIGKELHTFVDEKVDAAIVDRALAQINNSASGIGMRERKLMIMPRREGTAGSVQVG